MIKDLTEDRIEAILKNNNELTEFIREVYKIKLEVDEDRDGGNDVMYYRYIACEGIIYDYGFESTTDWLNPLRDKKPRGFPKFVWELLKVHAKFFKNHWWEAALTK